MTYEELMECGLEWKKRSETWEQQSDAWKALALSWKTAALERGEHIKELSAQYSNISDGIS